MIFSKSLLKPLLSSAVIIFIIAIVSQKYWLTDKLPADIASGNGRIEATEISIAAKNPGRIRELLVNEGEFVEQDQVVGYIDSDVLNAQLQQAEAQQRQALNAVSTAYSQLAQRKSERAALVAVLAQREAELSATKSRAKRTNALAQTGAASNKLQKMTWRIYAVLKRLW